MPHSLDAERALLGGLLIDPAAVARVSELISYADFYQSAHSTIKELADAAWTAVDRDNLPEEGVDLLIDDGSIIMQGSLKLTPNLEPECFYVHSLEGLRLLEFKHARKWMPIPAAGAER